MKRFILIITVGFLLPAAAFAREQSLLARITVYWASGGAGSDTCTRAHKCATGARLRAGHCAVDPKRIPYGSKVVFPDATCVAVDTGRDVINRKAARRSGHTATERGALVIDRFFETKGQAMSWANANPHFMTVRVLSPNDRLAENRALSAKRQSSQIIASKNSQSIAKQDIAISRVPSVVLSPLVDIPQNKLLADGGTRAGLQPSRRF
jgi:3D (Asp-Asp-Asp) domain-containing protein